MKAILETVGPHMYMDFTVGSEIAAEGCTISRVSGRIEAWIATGKIKQHGMVNDDATQADWDDTLKQATKEDGSVDFDFAVEAFKAEFPLTDKDKGKLDPVKEEVKEPEPEPEPKKEPEPTKLPDLKAPAAKK